MRRLRIPRRFASSSPASPHAEATSNTKPPSSFKDYIPSRGWQIFWAVTGSVSTLALYDSRKISETQASLAAIAKAEIADTPSPILSRPRHVIVCIAPGDSGRSWFEQFVKPVFDAAALDYTVWVPDKPGHLRARVRDYIWDGKRQVETDAAKTAADQLAHTFNVWDVRTWFGPSKETPEEYILRMAEKRTRKFHPEDGIIALGPEAYREMLQGLNIGLLTAPTENPEKRYVLHPVETSKEAQDAYEAEVKAADAEYNAARLYPQLQESPSNLVALGTAPDALPPIGYIPCRTYVGWSGLAVRCARWFYRRDTARTVGDAALDVCRAAVRPFDPARDLSAGVPADAVNLTVVEKDTPFQNGGSAWSVWTDLHPVVAQRLSVYATRAV
ncbi:mitochondrial import inner membrane translocase subunit tim54 [Entophlyctis luteolus]|nr:mitochondrial import inner membrane translocase subunit tim54 [Entophlyctis luteolus]KAJ3392118.1 mitochondrial import inner membrane translocase subunit tim54 [Entophlyctis sp. JEL0112]